VWNSSGKKALVILLKLREIPFWNESKVGFRAECKGHGRQ
jgi:hypothetical protein